MNMPLAWHFAWRSLSRHFGLSAATVLGIALSMAAIAAILIVDANSTESPVFDSRPAQLNPFSADVADNKRIFRVYFEKAGTPRNENPSLIPTQKGAAAGGISADTPTVRRGEEDYQAMRLAVRLASLSAFSVGAVIVFYTMRFSVVARSRELSLLLCLGEKRKNLALSLALEALLFGMLGTGLGLAAAFPMAYALLEAGISTTGRIPSDIFIVPSLELCAIAVLSLLIALLGVVSPARSLFRLNVVDVLQPRFLSSETDTKNLKLSGFSWLIPPLGVAAWLAVRPFLQSWLSVVQFFLLEALFVGLLAAITLWWVRPLLQAIIHLAERMLKPILPLETLLVGRRMRLSSHKLVFTIAAVTLVFSLLTALHDITRSLKQEIHDWASEALFPYVYFARNQRAVSIDKKYLARLEQRGLQLFRLSQKAEGEFPVRLIKADDINRVRQVAKQTHLLPGGVILSRTLAARFDVSVGDRLVIDTGGRQHRFDLIDVTDQFGYFAENGQYVDLKSYALFSDGNPLFAHNLEPTLGDLAMVKRADGRRLSYADVHRLLPHYRDLRWGLNMGSWQKREIDRDFLVFDFLLVMTVVLAAIGVTNAILIQVHAREREFAVLRTLGISRTQTARLLLVEGAVIGLASAFLALILGNALGAVSIGFLDRFTLFDYRFVFSAGQSLGIGLLAVLTCTLAAVYPTLVATRISSAESLHYE